MTKYIIELSSEKKKLIENNIFKIRPYQKSNVEGKINYCYDINVPSSGCKFPVAFLDIPDVIQVKQDLTIKYRLEKGFRTKQLDRVALFKVEEKARKLHFVASSWAPKYFATTNRPGDRSVTFDLSHVQAIDLNNAKFVCIYLTSKNRVLSISKLFRMKLIIFDYKDTKFQVEERDRPENKVEKNVILKEAAANDLVLKFADKGEREKPAEEDSGSKEDRTNEKVLLDEKWITVKPRAKRGRNKFGFDQLLSDGYPSNYVSAKQEINLTKNQTESDPIFNEEVLEATLVEPPIDVYLGQIPINKEQKTDVTKPIVEKIRPANLDDTTIKINHFDSEYTFVDLNQPEKIDPKHGSSVLKSAPLAERSLNFESSDFTHMFGEIKENENNFKDARIVNEDYDWMTNANATYDSSLNFDNRFLDEESRDVFVTDNDDDNEDDNDEESMFRELLTAEDNVGAFEKKILNYLRLLLKQTKILKKMIEEWQTSYLEIVSKLDSILNKENRSLQMLLNLKTDDEADPGSSSITRAENIVKELEISINNQIYGASSVATARDKSTVYTADKKERYGGENIPIFGDEIISERYKGTAGNGGRVNGKILGDKDRVGRNSKGINPWVDKPDVLSDDDIQDRIREEASKPLYSAVVNNNIVDVGVGDEHKRGEPSDQCGPYRLQDSSAAGFAVNATAKVGEYKDAKSADLNAKLPGDEAKTKSNKPDDIRKPLKMSRRRRRRRRRRRPFSGSALSMRLLFGDAGDEAKPTTKQPSSGRDALSHYSGSNLTIRLLFGDLKMSTMPIKDSALTLELNFGNSKRENSKPANNKKIKMDKCRRIYSGSRTGLMNLFGDEDGSRTAKNERKNRPEKSASWLHRRRMFKLASKKMKINRAMAAELLNADPIIRRRLPADNSVHLGSISNGVPAIFNGRPAASEAVPDGVADAKPVQTSIRTTRKPLARPSIRHSTEPPSTPGATPRFFQQPTANVLDNCVVEAPISPVTRFDAIVQAPVQVIDSTPAPAFLRTTIPPIVAHSLTGRKRKHMVALDSAIKIPNFGHKPIQIDMGSSTMLLPENAKFVEKEDDDDDDDDDDDEGVADASVAEKSHTTKLSFKNKGKRESSSGANKPILKRSKQCGGGGGGGISPRRHPVKNCIIEPDRAAIDGDQRMLVYFDVIADNSVLRRNCKKICRWAVRKNFAAAAYYEDRCAVRSYNLKPAQDIKNTANPTTNVAPIRKMKFNKTDEYIAAKNDISESENNPSALNTDNEEDSRVNDGPAKKIHPDSSVKEKLNRRSGGSNDDTESKEKPNLKTTTLDVDGNNVTKNLSLEYISSYSVLRSFEGYLTSAVKKFGNIIDQFFLKEDEFEKNKKEKSTDCDSALIPLLCVHG